MVIFVLKEYYQILSYFSVDSTKSTEINPTKITWNTEVMSILLNDKP